MMYNASEFVVGVVLGVEKR